MLVSCQPTFTFLLPYCSSSTLSTNSISTTCPLKTTFKRVPTPWIKPITTCVVYSTLAGASLETEYDSWEDPDDGSNSDYESEKQEEEEENEWVSGEEASFGESSSVVTRTQYEDDYIKEIEQLLTPDERAILEQNDAPVFSKISTTKWGLLQTLALSAQIPFMDKLLVQGLPIDAPDKDGLTALHKAVIGKREPVISHLLRKGANPRVRDKDGATPLHYAVQVGAMQSVKLLIKYKVDVNAEDTEGWTPLHVAIQSRCRDIAKVLLVNGADKTRRTKDGMSVLDLALCYGKDFKSYELTKLVKLVPAGIDP